MVPLAVLIVAGKWCVVVIDIGGGAAKVFLPALPAVGVITGPNVRAPHDAALTAAAGVGVGAVPGALPTLRPTEKENASIATATIARVASICGTRVGACLNRDRSSRECPPPPLGHGR